VASWTYQNFDLLLEAAEDGAFLARVTASALGESPSGRFTLPFDSTQLENMLLKVAPGLSGIRRTRADPLGQASMDLGGRLFETVFSEDIMLAWQRSQDLARDQGEGLRLRLRLTDAPSIAGLPWELLYDRRRNSFVAQSVRTPVVRYTDVPHPPRPLAVDGPLRILVVISSPVDLSGLDVDAEWRQVLVALEALTHRGTVRVDRLMAPTIQALSAWLRQHDVHILHFIGHGGYDERIQDGVVCFEDRYGRSSGVAPTVLGPYLRDHKPLRLVLLDASQSERVDLINSIVVMAQGLVLQHCTAVVAMQYSMSDAATTLFNRRFYGALADEVPVDQAVTRARKALLADYGTEWAAPALFVSTPDGQVFDHIATEQNVPAAAVAVPPPPPQYGTTPASPASPAPPTAHPTGQSSWDAAGPQPSTVREEHTVRVERPVPTRSAPSGRLVWRSVRETVSRWLSGSSTSTEPPSRTGTTQTPDSARTAYPRIDVRSRRSRRPDVVVVQEPFDVTVGLARFQDDDLAQTGGLRVAAARRTDLELVLTFDPSSLATLDPTRLTLTVTDDDPFPTARVTFTAQYRPDLPSVRRIGVQYLRDGQVVGIAWRRFVVVLYPAAIDGASAPTPEPNPLMDLAPLLGEDVPDLVLSICASDGPATGEFVWTAWASGPDIVVPDGPRISKLDNGLQQFAADMRHTVAYAVDSYGAYLSLVGKATKLGRAVPPGIASVVRRVVEDPARREAAAVLLLTEELALPWELAVFDPPLESAWGGTSPFLGSHAAISRWPLTQHRPRPVPRSTVTVRRAAVLTADYAGVPGCSELDHALAEARQVAALFAPPAVAVAPSLRDVVSMLRGVPPADVVHVALHGRFDAIGSDGGLVLLASDATGALSRTPQLLTPDQVETGRLDGGPFVFLNACQVAADKRVLADYAGFASTLLRIGATGVVAPLWNVDDDVAAEFAAAFYAATWTASGRDGTSASTSVAEAVRALRARYTEAAAETHTPGITATLIAFQVFGHPRLRLARV
jgi:CHAT domain-containing protein